MEMFVTQGTHDGVSEFSKERIRNKRWRYYPE